MLRATDCRDLSGDHQLRAISDGPLHNTSDYSSLVDISFGYPRRYRRIAAFEPTSIYLYSWTAAEPDPLTTSCCIGRRFPGRYRYSFRLLLLVACVRSRLAQFLDPHCKIREILVQLD